MKNTKKTPLAETTLVRRNEVLNMLIDRYEIAGRSDGFVMISGFQHIPEFGFVEQSRQIITTQHARSLISTISYTLDRMNKIDNPTPQKEENDAQK